MKYSFIVPVYNRPDEVDELLESLTKQTITDFEVIVVEDGSTVLCRDVCEKYRDLLNLHYFYKDNSGPGQSRNYGVERAQGDYVLILDSDVVVPAGYLQAVENELNTNDADAFGGPDAAHPSFTPKQKAISYSMTAFLTTGGIRGGKKKMVFLRRNYAAVCSPKHGYGINEERISVSFSVRFTTVVLPELIFIRSIPNP